MLNRWLDRVPDRIRFWLLVAGLLALILGPLIERRAWRWGIWRSAGGFLGEHALWIGFTVLAAVLALPWLNARWRARTHSRSSQSAKGHSWPWMLSYPGVLTISVSVAAVGVVTLVIMLRIAANSPAADRPGLQIDTVKYAQGSIAATGAAAALLLGVRRQQHTEQAQEHTEHDAAEKRVTEIYAKAAEQLGHAEAPVRLAGLYALERVAQGDPAQRQTIVDVICAYLRMPFTPPQCEATDRTPADQPDPEAPIPDDAITTERQDSPDPRQELQVRLTAQRILTRHLTSQEGAEQHFWPGIDLDLTDATLISWTFPNGRGNKANFSGAEFAGDAVFSGAKFAGDAVFSGAKFAGDAVFSGAKFAESAVFSGAKFAGVAFFSRAEFARDAFFGGAKFASDADFSEAKFAGVAFFSRAEFASDADFSGAKFAGDAFFSGAKFAESADFSEAKFAESASFRGAKFARVTKFSGAEFAGGADFRESEFAGSADFSWAKFAGGADFSKAKFAEFMVFHAAEFAEGTYFREAKFIGIADFRKTNFPRPLAQSILAGALAAIMYQSGSIWPPDWVVERDADEEVGRLVYQPSTAPTT